MTVKQIKYRNIGGDSYCRFCGEFVKFEEPNFITLVAGYRNKRVTICVHARHFRKSEIQKLIDKRMVDEL